MVVAKALCVVLLLYSASFGENRSLENESNSEKKIISRSTVVEKVKKTASDIEQMFRRITGVKDKIQFAYIYLQPQVPETIYFDNVVVSETMNGGRRWQRIDGAWPNLNTRTNFRAAFPDTNGHSEYHLLAGDQMGKMINPETCPKYVILYSSNLPCVSGASPCAPLVLQARNKLAELCKKSPFYLYTSLENPSSPQKQVREDYKKNIQKKINFIQQNGINWIYKE